MIKLIFIDITCSIGVFSIIEKKIQSVIHVTVYYVIFYITVLLDLLIFRYILFTRKLRYSFHTILPWSLTVSLDLPIRKGSQRSSDNEREIVASFFLFFWLERARFLAVHNGQTSESEMLETSLLFVSFCHT